MIFVKNIAAGPAERRRQGQHKAHQRDMFPSEAPLHQHQHAEDRQSDPRQLLALQAFAKDEGAENNGKEGLRLQNQRRQPRRHAQADSAEQKGKLAKANGQAIAQQQAQRNRWPGDKQQRREGHQHKAQARQHQRRHIVQSQLNHHEVKPHTTTTSSASSPSFLVIPCLCRY